MIRSQINELKAKAREVDSVWGLADKAISDNAKYGMPNKDFVEAILRKKDQMLLDLIMYIDSIDD